MKKLTNQTIFQCEHCNKRFLSLSGIIKHERYFCRVIVGKRELEKQKNCNHENVAEAFEPMPGEGHLQQPAYEYCADCGKKKHPFKGWDYED